MRRAATAYPDASYPDILAELTTARSAYDDLRLSLGYWPD
jgi:hypothetical protein